jgi:hypothetical protein
MVKPDTLIVSGFSIWRTGGFRTDEKTSCFRCYLPVQDCGSPVIDWSYLLYFTCRSRSSPFVGWALADADVRAQTGVTVIAIELMAM